MGVSVEGERIESELDVDIPQWPDKPLWERKLLLWAQFIEKTCPAKRGVGRGVKFCGWAGHTCYYNGCPRRIFEEDAVADGIPQPVPTPDFVTEFTNNTKKLNKLQNRFEKAMVRISELEKEKES